MKRSLYVDDPLVAGTTLKNVLKVERELFDRLERHDCSETAICFGLEISQSCSIKIVKICQTDYVRKALLRFSMQNSNPVNTPIKCQIDAEALKEETFSSALYYQPVRSLMHVVICN